MLCLLPARARLPLPLPATCHTYTHHAFAFALQHCPHTSFYILLFLICFLPFTFRRAEDPCHHAAGWIPPLLPFWFLLMPVHHPSLPTLPRCLAYFFCLCSDANAVAPGWDRTFCTPLPCCRFHCQRFPYPSSPPPPGFTHGFFNALYGYLYLLIAVLYHQVMPFCIHIAVIQPHWLPNQLPPATYAYPTPIPASCCMPEFLTTTICLVATFIIFGTTFPTGYSPSCHYYHTTDSDYLPFTHTQLLLHSYYCLLYFPCRSGSSLPSFASCRCGCRYSSSLVRFSLLLLLWMVRSCAHLRFLRALPPVHLPPPRCGLVTCAHAAGITFPAAITPLLRLRAYGNTCAPPARTHCLRATTMRTCAAAAIPPLCLFKIHYAYHCHTPLFYLPHLRVHTFFADTLCCLRFRTHAFFRSGFTPPWFPPHIHLPGCSAGFTLRTIFLPHAAARITTSYYLLYLLYSRFRFCSSLYLPLPPVLLPVRATVRVHHLACTPAFRRGSVYQRCTCCQPTLH